MHLAPTPFLSILLSLLLLLAHPTTAFVRRSNPQNPFLKHHLIRRDPSFCNIAINGGNWIYHGCAAPAATPVAPITPLQPSSISAKEVEEREGRGKRNLTGRYWDI
jgi:hypothetical protein